MKPFVVPCLALLGGCATILGEQTKEVRLISEPPGAEVLMDGLLVGRAPVAVSILEQDDYDFSFRWDGGAVAHCQLAPSWKPYFLAVDLLGGIAGILIDTSTNLWLRQDEDSCTGRASQGGAP